MTLPDAIASMGAVLSRSESQVLLMSTVDSDGAIGFSECFSLSGFGPSDEDLLHLANRVHPWGLVFGSRARGRLDPPDRDDVDLTLRLARATVTEGFEFVDHFLFAEHSFTSMREAMQGRLR